MIGYPVRFNLRRRYLPWNGHGMFVPPSFAICLTTLMLGLAYPLSVIQSSFIVLYREQLLPRALQWSSLSELDGLTWYPQSLSFITITPPPPVSVSLDSMICTTNTSAFPLLMNNITRPRPSRRELNVHSPKSVSSEAPDFLRHLANQTRPLNREVKPSITLTS